MKTAKSLLAVCLCLALLLGAAAGCGGTDAGGQTESPPENQTEPQTGGETGQPADDAAPSGGAGPGGSGEPKVLNFGVDQESASLDPLLSSQIDFQVMAGACLGQLWWINHKGELVYDLGTGYEYNDDNTAVIFHLREGVKFHNGSEFNAEDVLYTIGRCFDSPQYAQRVACLDWEKCHAIDDYTVELAFRQFEASFAESMSAPIYYILDKEWCEEVGEEGIGMNVNGTGPYVLSSREIGTKLVLERNEAYYGEPGYYDEINIYFIPESSTRMMEFEVGTIDMAYITTATDIQAAASGQYENAANLQITMQQAGGFGFNMRDKADMWPIELRMAIAHAIDAQAIVDVICGGVYARATSCEPSANWGYLDVGGYEYDPDYALECLHAAGYDSFEFTVQVTNSNFNVPILEAIQAYLRDVNITMNIETLDATVYRTMMVGGETVAGITGSMGGGDPGDVFIPWEEGSGNSLLEVSGHLAELLVNAKAESDRNARIEMYHEFQQIVHDEYLFIPIYEATYNYIARNTVACTEEDFDIVGMPRLPYFGD